MSKQKILIDTDPGVDDTMAIFYAMESEQFELVGLTTIFGNVDIDLATINALRMLEVLGLPDVPVAKGADNPLVRPFIGSIPHAHGHDGQGNANFPLPKTQAIKQSAAEFIVEQIMSNPNEIILVPLGPLTNIALALHLEPRIAENVKEVVMMGGAALVPGNMTPAGELNIYNDPEAADMVFAASWQITMLGLDVTEQTWMSPDQLALYGKSQKATSQHISKIIPFYSKLMEAVFLGKKGMCLHDPSAISYLLHPELYSIKQSPIIVSTDGAARGKTWMWTAAYSPRYQWKNRPMVNVCLGVDAKQAVEYIVATI